MGVIFSCSGLLWGTRSELFNNMQKGLVNKNFNKVLTVTEGFVQFIIIWSKILLLRCTFLPKTVFLLRCTFLPKTVFFLRCTFLPKTVFVMRYFSA